MTHRTESLWRATHQLHHAAPLSGDREADVAIVGGGVSGLTAAVLLARGGLRVVLVERSHRGIRARTRHAVRVLPRDQNGVLHSLSAVCTHLACDVAWNHAEQTWDCPCHGSRFSPEGKVINGPAVSDLRWYPIPATRR